MSRAIDTEAIIRRVFEIYVSQSGVLMPAAAAVFLVSGLLSLALVEASAGLAFLALLISIVATSLFTGMIVELVANVRDGHLDSSPGQLLAAVMPVLGKLIGVSLVAAIAEGVGLLLFIVPGLVLLTIWSVFAPIVVLERPPGLGALSRSRDLVRGNGWRVFWVILLLVLFVGVLAYGITYAAESASATAGLLLRVVLGVLTAPISALAAAVLYFELRDADTAPAPPAEAPLS